MLRYIKLIPIIFSTSLASFPILSYEPGEGNRVEISLREIGPYPEGYFDNEGICFDWRYQYSDSFNGVYTLRFTTGSPRDLYNNQGTIRCVGPATGTISFVLINTRIKYYSVFDMIFQFTDEITGRLMGKISLHFDFDEEIKDINPLERREVTITHTWAYEYGVFTGQQDYFSFVHLPDVAYHDIYYRLDVSMYDFYYDGPSRTYEDAGLYFGFLKEPLKYLDTKNDGGFEIPLKLTFNKDGTVHVSFKNRLFVNRNTGEMSLTYKKGFISTEYFYMPKDYMDELQGQHMYIYFQGLGVSHQTFAFNTSYSAGRKLIGECSDSEYCVVGGVR